MEQLGLFTALQLGEENAKMLLLWKQEQAVGMHNAEKYRRLTFAEAAPLFVNFKSTHVKKTTLVMYDLYIKHLMTFFRDKRLELISIKDVRDYQDLRKGKVGASQINHELNTLSQMLKKAGVWKQIEEWYKPVTEETPEPMKVMPEDEEDRFFKIAASPGSEWQEAYWVASITNNTSCAGCELRLLRLEDVNLSAEVPHVRVAEGKNRFRKYRVVPLNETAFKNMHRAVNGAIKKGSRDGKHFLFPFRVKRGEWDPTRPASASWLKKQWKKLCSAAGVSITPHNLRFQCATRMVENGVPEETIVRVFGWKNRKMLQHYSRPRLNSALDAVRRIDPSAKKGVFQAEKPWLPSFAQEK